MVLLVYFYFHASNPKIYNIVSFEEYTGVRPPRPLRICEVDRP